MRLLERCPCWEFQLLDGRKEFLEREDKERLCCKRNPRLKTGDLNVQPARELETMKLLSGQVDKGSQCRGHQSNFGQNTWWQDDEVFC
ncbi:uncharacterized protein LOC128931159 isoform X2 [Callithrix jacchus]